MVALRRSNSRRLTIDVPLAQLNSPPSAYPQSPPTTALEHGGEDSWATHVQAIDQPTSPITAPNREQIQHSNASQTVILPSPPVLLHSHSMRRKQKSRYIPPPPGAPKIPRRSSKRTLPQAMKLAATPDVSIPLSVLHRPSHQSYTSSVPDPADSILTPPMTPSPSKPSSQIMSILQHYAYQSPKRDDEQKSGIRKKRFKSPAGPKLALSSSSASSGTRLSSFSEPGTTPRDVNHNDGQGDGDVIETASNRAPSLRSIWRWRGQSSSSTSSPTNLHPPLPRVPPISPMPSVGKMRLPNTPTSSSPRTPTSPAPPTMHSQHPYATSTPLTPNSANGSFPPMAPSRSAVLPFIPNPPSIRHGVSSSSSPAIIVEDPNGTTMRPAEQFDMNSGYSKSLAKKIFQYGFCEWFASISFLPHFSIAAVAWRGEGNGRSLSIG